MSAPNCGRLQRGLRANRPRHHDGAAGSIAKAFCTHHFAEADPHLAVGVQWVLVGGPTLIGKQEVTAACERTLGELASVTTRFRNLRVIDAEGTAVVDSIAEYHEPGGRLSVVASCDILDFTDSLVSHIVSYTVELAEPAPEGA